MSLIAGYWNGFITRRNIAYLFVNIGNIPIMALVSSFLAIYYVNVLGMDEYAVGTMFLVARFFDGINDPFIGSIIDRGSEDRFFRFKKILMMGTMVCSLNYIILWIGPAIVTSSVKLIVAYISYLLLGITFPIMDISLNSLLPILTDDIDEREILSSIKIIGYGIGTALIEICVPVILSVLGSVQSTYIGIALSCSLAVVFFSIVGVVGLKNSRVIYIQRETMDVSGFENFFKVFFKRNVWGTFVSGLCFYTGNATLAISNTYYVSFYLGDVKYLAYVTLATYSLEMFVVLLVPICLRKWQTKKLFSWSLIIAGIGVLIRFISWENTNIGLLALLISSSIFGMGYGFTMILYYNIQASNVDNVYKETGFRAEGTIASLMSMANKIGKGVGGALPLYILGVMKTSDGIYTEMSLRLIDGLLPAVLLLIGGIIFANIYQEE